MKAVIYARYSTGEDQRSESAEAQLEFCRDWCRKNGHIVIREYVDEALSGTSAEKRDEFLRMIRDAKTFKDHDLVVVHKNDRFARNRYEDAIYKYQLSEVGIKVIYALTPIDDSPEGIILDSVLVGMAEYYSKNLAREVMKGHGQNAKKGWSNGGRPPLGYEFIREQVGVRKNGKPKYAVKYEINELEAVWVKYIFESVAAGKTYTQIIDTLNNKMGARTREGKKFQLTSLNSILQNEKYIGNYIYNKIVHKVGGKRNNRITKSEDEIYRLEGAIPAIISKELWEKVQLVLIKRKRTRGNGGKAKMPYYLSGLVFCGDCGEKMYGNINADKKGYYLCKNRKNKENKCNKPAVSKDKLENYVAEELRLFFLDKERMSEYAAKISEMLGIRQVDKKTEINLLQNELAAAEKEKSNLVQSLKEGIPASLIKDDLEKAHEKCEALKARINELMSIINKQNYTKEQLVDYLMSHRELTLEDIKKKFQEYILKVVITEKVEIYMLSTVFGIPLDSFGGGGATLKLSNVYNYF